MSKQLCPCHYRQVCPTRLGLKSAEKQCTNNFWLPLILLLHTLFPRVLDFLQSDNNQCVFFICVVGFLTNQSSNCSQGLLVFPHSASSRTLLCIYRFIISHKLTFSRKDGFQNKNGRSEDKRYCFLHLLVSLKLYVLRYIFFGRRLEIYML